MSTQIYDANGNQVGGQTGICARCGAHIKYIFTFNGQTYGSECIEAVTGVGKDYQVFKGKELDLEASKAKKIQAEIDRQNHLMAWEAKRQVVAELQANNAKKFEEVIYLLENTSGDFAASVVSQIKRSETSTELYQMLSPRQMNIVAEIYGKAFGKKNSKAYQAGVEEFYQKYGEE